MKIKICFIIIFSLTITGWSQSIKFPDPTPTVTVTPAPTETPLPIPTAELPNGYRDLLLGMSFSEIETALKSDLHFNYQGADDVTMLTKPNQSLIECEGSYFIDKGLFQFFQEKLYIIIIEIDRTKMDYFTMYSSFIEKYGEPDSLDPSKVVWKNETVQLTLEKPLSVKYIDLRTFSILERKSDSEESFFERSRKEFIDEF